MEISIKFVHERSCFNGNNLSLLKIIIMILTLSPVTILSQTPNLLFGSQSDMVLSNLTRYDPYFVVKDTSSIQNIINKYDSICLQRLDNSIEGRRLNAYVKIVFENLNEDEINTFINKIYFHNNIISVYFKSCSFRELPKSIDKLGFLEEIHFEDCNNIENMNGFNSLNSVFGLFFKNCRIKKLPIGIERLNPMLKLWLRFPDDFNQFDLNSELARFEQRKNIIALYVRYKRLSDFPESIFLLTPLNTIVFQSNNMIKYPVNYDALPNIMHI